jgi:hypothetical protein
MERSKLTCIGSKKVKEALCTAILAYTRIEEVNSDL